MWASRPWTMTARVSQWLTMHNTRGAPRSDDGRDVTNLVTVGSQQLRAGMRAHVSVLPPPTHSTPVVTLTTFGCSLPKIGCGSACGHTGTSAELVPNGHGTTVACNRSTNTLSLHFVTATDTSRERHRQGHRSRFKRCCAEPDGSERTPGETGQWKRGGRSKTTRRNPREKRRPPSLR